MARDNADLPLKTENNKAANEIKNNTFFYDPKSWQKKKFWNNGEKTNHVSTGHCDRLLPW